MVSKINFEKALFPFRPYVYHKDDSTYLERLLVNLPILFLQWFQFMESHKRLSRLFSCNLLAMFSLFGLPSDIAVIHMCYTLCYMCTYFHLFEFINGQLPFIILLLSHQLFSIMTGFFGCHLGINYYI